MRGWFTGTRLWVARRLVVSAFVTGHAAAVVLWVMPPCPLRGECVGVVKYYILPLGFWQYWGMFAPDPPVNSMTLEAEVVDAHGLRHNFAFPDVRSDTGWRSVPRFRHPKYALNLLGADPELERNRAFAARHVMRQLKIPAAAYPADVRLYYQVRALPAPGHTWEDGAASSQAVMLCSYRFTDESEVRP